MTSSSTDDDDLAGLEALAYWTHLCARVRRMTDADYLCQINTCLVDSDVSLNPLGLLLINTHVLLNKHTRSFLPSLHL